jgi:hypothetical protein
MISNKNLLPWKSRYQIEHIAENGKYDVDFFAQGPTIVLNYDKREHLFTCIPYDHFQDNGKYLENL